MIQVDGLSQKQLEYALDHNEMPFLKRLIHREHGQVHTHYSGLPSTTTAVQAELLYGIKTAVPAFAFKDRETGVVQRMFEPGAAAKLERQIEDAGYEGLLKDGSAYSDNFTGGAAESHFCPSSMGWGGALRAANPFVLIAFLLSNLYSFIRVGVLFALEIVIAIVDFIRGFARGYDFISELKFIPSRVGISILLRELCVIGGKIDISRGLPIIHMNLLGYDEQSHRRGPTSLFAHWTLKGIDDAIARLWREASKAPWRHYEVWIYSDHGQTSVRPYHEVQGYSLRDAVAQTLEGLNGKVLKAEPLEHSGIQTQRARYLGGKRVQRLFSITPMEDAENQEDHSSVTAPGPIGHIYLDEREPLENYDAIARELVHKHKVPVVLWFDAEGVLRARTDTTNDAYVIPKDVSHIFGAEHPFVDAMGEDLVRLCRHPNAGSIVALGWRKGLASLTFAEESGAHGGTTPDETRGFALLPADTSLPVRPYDYLRPIDLYQAAREYLGRSPRSAESSQPMTKTQPKKLRVMSYNVHSCLGMDGRIDVERIARVIGRVQPDVVALQELDVGRERTQGVDQAQQIAQYLEMAFHFHPAIHLEEERYGDAILTHLPERLIKADLLPTVPDKAHLEPRGALWVAIDVGGTQVQIINTHLGLSPRERILQVEALLGEQWMGHDDCRDPLIVLGDFNAMPGSAVCRRFKSQLRDVQLAVNGQRPRATFPTRFPVMRIDHVFVSSGIEPKRIEIPRNQMVKVASDHLPLVVDLEIF